MVDSIGHLEVLGMMMTTAGWMVTVVVGHYVFDDFWAMATHAHWSQTTSPTTTNDNALALAE